MNKKAAIYYEVIMLFTVLIALPVLVWRMEKITDIKEVFLGEGQIAILDLPYEKENTIHFVQMAAELEMPDILKEMAAKHGYGTEPPGGIVDACTVINTDTELKKVNRPDVLGALTNAFNAHVDKYISDYNVQSDTPDLPRNNYELFIKDDNIHAIALLPVAQTSKTGRGTVTMWFAPSFTINYPHKLDEYKKTFDILGLVVENCAKKSDAIKCVKTYTDPMPGWDAKQEGDMIVFNVPSAHGNLCYAMKTG